jgi:hypothetical protein
MMAVFYLIRMEHRYIEQNSDFIQRLVNFGGWGVGKGLSEYFKHCRLSTVSVSNAQLCY